MSAPVITPATGRARDLAEVPAREVRADIQGLRAVAVLLVFGYHLYANLLPGGFIGVDVFFVISGFLITSHLLRHPPRSIRDFAGFWGRRIRRLLPASLLVVATTIVIGCVVLPATQLAILGRDALSSALYVENWTLAATSVDYLANGTAPSPLQHYWSLGVEEQFYLIWPFLVAGLALLAARRRARPAVVATVGLSVFLVASLVVSVVWTAVEPAAAYFVTPTRLWELAAGGVVAAAGSIPVTSARALPVLRSGLAWAGLAVIGVSVLVINGNTPFPGAIALLPVGGACLVIAANAERGYGSPTIVLGLRPIQYIGDISYSVYLWHFPLIVLATAALGMPLTIVPKILIVVATFVLAALTKRLVEDPVRRSKPLQAPVARTFVFGALITALVVGLSFIPTAQVSAIARTAAKHQAAAAIANRGCVGAAALSEPGCDFRGTGILPAPVLAKQDVADAYADGCIADKPYAGLPACHYGPAGATERIAVVGNSHAIEWLPALQKLAQSDNFAITTYVASSCPITDAHVVFDTTANSNGCRAWGERVVNATSNSNVDLVVVSESSLSSVVGVKASDKYQAQLVGYRTMLQKWVDAGTHVLVIRDTPTPGFDIPDCVSQHTTSLSSCDGPRGTWLPPDPMIGAATAVNSPLVSTVDLSNQFCGPTTCYSVAGGVLVYFDYLHVDATYMRTVAPYLNPALKAAIAGK